MSTIRELWNTEFSTYIIQVNFLDRKKDYEEFADEWVQMRGTPHYTTIAEPYKKIKALPPAFFEGARVRIIRVHQNTKVTTTRYFETAFSESNPEVQP